ncbi:MULTISPECIES: hypothetical protein [Rhizobium]|uniref:hypothetical protein n=1 Tax=Rhizobium TaxID=379 RepID=UPI001D89CCD5|nr:MULTISPECIES: hypothetical protein [Rhizobium]MBX4906799.1 hypothetical protein [Rhizobium bangladeshense]MBX5221861.1 hypothetical protein [Rhizobium sp. NLR8a]MBX5227841.1 hypothetical protein [Rhizobium sp. NLR9b]MBX5234291.1 hypothetical protein [Rhizobium sp. NLR4a]MBX5239790.1 hypothetical protein [Rhizobium sp. NLR22b]
MYRITVSMLLVMMRLVIVVSLAGYSLANASAAMHGSAFPELRVAAAEMMPSHEGHDLAEAGHHDHSRIDMPDDDGGPSKLVKQECCKDFCGGLGIICESPYVGGPVVTSIRQFLDDRTTFGEQPPLHRPPNI